MNPIVFWSIGTVSLVTSLIAVASRKPVGSLRALVLLTTANSLLVLGLGATLLGLEMLLGTAVAAGLVWWAVLRPRKMKLAVPGRARLNVSKMVGFFSALSLTGLLVWAIWHSVRLDGRVASPGYDAADGMVAGLFVVGSALVLCFLLVQTRRREDAEEAAAEKAASGRGGEPA